MQTAAIILGLAALGGLTLAVMRFRGLLRPPTWMALGHGAIAATGLGFLGYAAYYPGIPHMGLIALGILIAAALGGATLFLGFHLRRRPLPIPLVILHGLAAATGYGVLLYTLYGGA